MGNKRLVYDDHHRLVSITEDGVELERYTYTDDNTFTVSSVRNFSIAVPGTTQFSEVKASFESTFTVNPETFEMRVHTVEGTFDETFAFANGTAQYSYTDTDEGLLEFMTVELPSSWREGVSGWGLSCQLGFPDCSRVVVGVRYIYEKTEAGLYIIVTSGSTEIHSLTDPNQVSDVFDLSNPVIECSSGPDGLKTCVDVLRGERDYTIKHDVHGNIIEDHHKETYSYSCWSPDDTCTQWRYVPWEAILPRSARRQLGLNAPLLVRVPCQWAPAVSMVFL